MREMVALTAEPRAERGKGAAYRTRLKGRIPGIVYGGKVDPETVQLDERNFDKLYYTGAMLQTLVMLEVAGKKTRVIPRAVQVDPVTDRPIHVDFLRLEPGARLRLAIPVRFRGQENSPGLKLGGVINVVTHEIEVFFAADNLYRGNAGRGSRRRRGRRGGSGRGCRGRRSRGTGRRTGRRAGRCSWSRTGRRRACSGGNRSRRRAKGQGRGQGEEVRIPNSEIRRPGALCIDGASEF